ncbi:MAG: hypothetical protein AAF267_17305 [Deinococcota bacterium]
MSTDSLIGIQISPISFIDEGVEDVLETLQTRASVNTLFIGTVSWLGLKVGRSISHELDGFPDHGIPEPMALQGGAYFEPHPEYYTNTLIKDFRSKDPQMAGKDILNMVIPAAKARGIQVYVELMEPFFKYAGHGSASSVNIPNMPQCLEVDCYGRIGSEPSISEPNYRRWIHGIIEDQCRNYELTGIMWCNERRSPLDQVFAGGAPGDFSPASAGEATQQGINVELTKKAFREVVEVVSDIRTSEANAHDGALVEVLRVLLANPEVFVWEKFWLERNKDLDRELYGLVKWINPNLQFGLNVWNRNHFSLLRKAQWPWAEQVRYADWVKPITYQHQAGEIYQREMKQWHASLLKDVSPDLFNPLMYQFLGLDEAPWQSLMQTGMNPETYVYGQCQDAVRGVDRQIPVYMGLGVDAPRVHPDQAKCTPEIVYQSVLATYKAGGGGVIFSPNYASMNLTNLDGATKAFKELGIVA